MTWFGDSFICVIIAVIRSRIHSKGSRTNGDERRDAASGNSTLGAYISMSLNASDKLLIPELGLRIGEKKRIIEYRQKFLKRGLQKIFVNELSRRKGNRVMGCKYTVLVRVRMPEAKSKKKSVERRIFCFGGGGCIWTRG